MNIITTTKITMRKIRTIIMTKTKNITTMTRTAMIKSIIMMTRSTTMTAKKASPANAIQIVKALTETISGLDKDNAQTYQKNAEAYIAKLEKLDKDFHDVIDHAKRKEIIVGDRFPFLYFAKEFGLTYYAAFPGCSTDTEANPATIAFLVDKVKEDHIPVVFHIEMSNEQMSKAIAEATGAKNELLNAVHNVSDEEFKKGVTYIDLMNHNVKVLKEALN